MFHLIRDALKGRNHRQYDDPDAAAERTRIAAGVVLLEAARADNECSDRELDHAIDTLRTDFNVSREQAEDLLKLADREQNRAVDLFEFTNHINNQFSRQEKKAVLEAVWRIIHLDGQLEKHEDYFVRNLTHLLRLTHTDMIDAKLKAREQLR